jgi:hypothetical protein
VKRPTPYRLAGGGDRYRGWQLPVKWLLVIGREGDQRTYTYDTLKEAEDEGHKYLLTGYWDYATIYMKEVFRHAR